MPKAQGKEIQHSASLSIIFQLLSLNFLGSLFSENAYSPMCFCNLFNATQQTRFSLEPGHGVGRDGGSLLNRRRIQALGTLV